MTKCFFTIFQVVLILFVFGCSKYDPTAELQNAMEEARAGKYSEALKRTKMCLRYNPKDVSSQLLDGYCHFMYDETEHEKEQALYNLRRVCNTYPDNFDAAYFYGWALFQMKKYSDAVPPLENAYALRNPKERDLIANIQAMLGTCYVVNNLQEQALRVLQPLRISPRYNRRPELYNLLGIMALKRLSPKESIAFFKQALAYDGANPGVLQNLAVTYDLYLNDVANARKTYIASHNALAPRKDVKGMMAIRKRLIQLERRNGGK